MPDFSAMGVPLIVFYSMAILASIILVIQVLLMLFGFDGDSGLGMDDLGETEGLGFISVRSLTGFFGGFGWMGVIMLESGSALPIATATGVGVGGILMLSVAYMMKILYSLKESGTIDFENAIDQVGTVYLSVPPNESGPGKVQVMVQGRLKIVTAYTKSGEKILSQKKVKVTELLDPRTLLVEPLGAGTKEEKEQENA